MIIEEYYLNIKVPLSHRKVKEMFSFVNQIVETDKGNKGKLEMVYHEMDLTVIFKLEK